MTFTTYLKSLDTRSITHFVLFVKSILTSSPHSVTVTTFPDISIRLSVLLDTSRLDLVVRRDMSSTLLHTPITSVKGYTKQRAFVFLFRILVIHSLQQSYKYLAQNTKTTTHKQINTVSDLFFSPIHNYIHTQVIPCPTAYGTNWQLAIHSRRQRPARQELASIILERNQ